MNWRRGAFRAWIVSSVAWLAVFGGITATDWFGLARRAAAQFSDQATIAYCEARAEHPPVSGTPGPSPALCRAIEMSGTVPPWQMNWGAQPLPPAPTAIRGLPPGACIDYIPPPVPAANQVPWCSPSTVQKAYASQTPTPLAALSSSLELQILLGLTVGVPVLVLVAGLGVGWVVAGLRA